MQTKSQDAKVIGFGISNKRKV